MAQVKTPASWRPSAEFRRESDDINRIFKKAVAEARAENRRLGIPNIQTDEEGRLTEELPDGTVRVIENVAAYRIPSPSEREKK